MDRIYAQPIQTAEGLKTYYEWAGNSSETKPIVSDATSGSKFHEVDTATLWSYDASTHTWYEQVELGGGS